MRRQLRLSLVFLAVFTLLTGVIYPLVVTGIAQTFLSSQANGSIVTANGNNAGSELIGQPFSDPRYFWGRLSATVPFPYNAAASSGSNYGPTNPELRKAMESRMEALRAADPDNTDPVPIDLVTSSGSGLDPHISIAAANYQIGRVARNRGNTNEQVKALVGSCTEGRQFGVLGEPRVSVLRLNLMLDEKAR